MFTCKLKLVSHTGSNGPGKQNLLKLTWASLLHMLVMLRILGQMAQVHQLLHMKKRSEVEVEGEGEGEVEGEVEELGFIILC